MPRCRYDVIVDCAFQPVKRHGLKLIDFYIVQPIGYVGFEFRHIIIGITAFTIKGLYF
jgi:hypothetical protein